MEVETFPCDYCGEDIQEGEKTYEVPIPARGDSIGVLCCPECQLSYSKFIVGNGHSERELLIRAQHHGHHHEYAPPPARTKKYNKHDYTPRSVWLAKIRK